MLTDSIRDSFKGILDEMEAEVAKMSGK